MHSPSDLSSQPLDLTVHSLPPAASAVPAQEMAQQKRGRWKMLAVLAICTAPVVASYLSYFVIRPQGRTNYSTLIQPTRPLPADLPLTTLDGLPVTAPSLKGQWLLVVVAGGACDDRCNRHLFLERQLREMMGKDRDRIDKLWLVSDDAPVKPALRDALSAPPTTVLRVPREALARWLQPEPGHALEDTLYIVDPMGDWMMRAPAEPVPAKLKGDLTKLLAASAGWDRPGR